MVGEANVRVCHKGQQVTLPVVVVKGDGPSLPKLAGGSATRLERSAPSWGCIPHGKPGGQVC